MGKVQKWFNLAIFLTSQSYDFDAFAHAGAPLGVEWLQNLWKSYEVFEKFSLKGLESKLLIYFNENES